MDSYIEKMQARENLCLAYMKKADDILLANGNLPSKEECIYLQKAASLRYEMAQMSVGEERLYQQRKVQELNQRIKNIVRVLRKSRRMRRGQRRIRMGRILHQGGTGLRGATARGLLPPGSRAGLSHRWRTGLRKRRSILLTMCPAWGN